MRLGESGSELERPVDSGSRAADRVLDRQVAVMSHGQQQRGVGDPGVGECVTRVELDRALEQ